MDRSKQMVAGLINSGALSQEGKFVMRERPDLWPVTSQCRVIACDYPSRYPPQGIIASGSNWAEVLANLQPLRRK